MSNGILAGLIVLVVLAILISAVFLRKGTNSGPLLPHETMSISVEEYQREAFFQEVRKFSEDFGFAIRIAPISPSGREFVVELRQHDIDIIGDNGGTPQHFDFGFYGGRVIRGGIPTVPSDHFSFLASEFEKRMNSSGMEVQRN